jgi:hypothetical protein
MGVFCMNNSKGEMAEQLLTLYMHQSIDGPISWNKKDQALATNSVVSQFMYLQEHRLSLQIQTALYSVWKYIS